MLKAFLYLERLTWTFFWSFAGEQGLVCRIIFALNLSSRVELGEVRRAQAGPAVVTVKIGLGNVKSKLGHFP